MTPRRVRLVRLMDMVRYDCTRPTEFANGFASFVIGAWILWVYMPPNAETAYWLWHYLGPTAQGYAFLVAGAVEMLAAGTKWVALRKYAAMAVGMGALGACVLYLQTAPTDGAVPFMALLVVREFWVSWRIVHDKAVNGADRRAARQLYGVD